MAGSRDGRLEGSPPEGSPARGIAGSTANPRHPERMGHANPAERSGCERSTYDPAPAHPPPALIKAERSAMRGNGIAFTALGDAHRG